MHYGTRIALLFREALVYDCGRLENNAMDATLTENYWFYKLACRTAKRFIILFGTCLEEDQKIVKNWNISSCAYHIWSFTAVLYWKYWSDV